MFILGDMGVGRPNHPLVLNERARFAHVNGYLAFFEIALVFLRLGSGCPIAPTELLFTAAKPVSRRLLNW